MCSNLCLQSLRKRQPRRQCLRRMPSNPGLPERCSTNRPCLHDPGTIQNGTFTAAQPIVQHRHPLQNPGRIIRDHSRMRNTTVRLALPCRRQHTVHRPDNLTMSSMAISDVETLHTRHTNPSDPVRSNTLDQELRLWQTRVLVLPWLRTMTWTATLGGLISLQVSGNQRLTSRPTKRPSRRSLCLVSMITDKAGHANAAISRSNRQRS